MRKYIIGGLAGLAIGLSATAYADDIQNLIGKTIQGQTEVYLDGERVDTAIIVDGKSYTPTRKIAEAAGQDVSFNKGGIYLESQETTPIFDPTPTPTPIQEVAEQQTPTPTPAKQEYSAAAIDREIKSMELMVRMTQAAIDEYKTRSGMTEEQRQKAIDGMKAKLDIAQSELDTWNQRKVEIEAQQ